MIVWHNVADNPPPQKTLLMVTGSSGYATHTKFLTLAYIDEEYRPSRGGPLRWQSVTNDSLSDNSWHPTHWAWPLGLPGEEVPTPKVVEAPLSKRPVMWRVKDYADGWIPFHNEEAAINASEVMGAVIQGLYTRDGSVDVDALPRGFEWINKPVTVRGEDFTYEALCLCSFPKSSGKVRYIVEDNGRLFIQRKEQLTFATQSVVVESPTPRFYPAVSCAACNGSGNQGLGRVCQTCSGKGYVLNKGDE